MVFSFIHLLRCLCFLIRQKVLIWNFVFCLVEYCLFSRFGRLKFNFFFCFRVLYVVVLLLFFFPFFFFSFQHLKNFKLNEMKKKEESLPDLCESYFFFYFRKFNFNFFSLVSFHRIFHIFKLNFHFFFLFIQNIRIACRCFWINIRFFYNFCVPVSFVVVENETFVFFWPFWLVNTMMMMMEIN